MGGRGKTPVVALLARLLAARGEQPAILSRGYRRRRPEPGVVIVSDGRRLGADLDRSGDEPLMLARLAPSAAVLVCDVRATAAAVAETTLGATVHLLDDGFQHRAMARDIDIVLVTP
ncbi:MAG TPA: tetraacyldisaccharide 4'-kinase, partial [Vicinamibacterales bacterium]|nr:tetraacyldisaccharide 4'-kinase [Vicinamibacterales bacterium]